MIKVEIVLCRDEARPLSSHCEMQCLPHVGEFIITEFEDWHCVTKIMEIDHAIKNGHNIVIKVEEVS